MDFEEEMRKLGLDDSAIRDLKSGSASSVKSSASATPKPAATNTVPPSSSGSVKISTSDTKAVTSSASSVKGTTKVPSASVLAAEAENAKLRAELEAIKGKTATVLSSSSTPSASVIAAEAERDRLLREAADADRGIRKLTVEATKATVQLQNRLKMCDVCFLMDCTGSMGSWIAQCKENVVKIVDHVSTMSKGQAFIRAAFVAYRDIGDGSQRFQVQDFVEKDNIATFHSFMRSVPATGGADGPEDVAGGLEKVLGLTWKAATRLVIHFADAPCHGDQYHGGMGDDYPKGDPEGKVPEKILAQIMGQLDCSYYFVKINTYTDQMIKIFNAHVESTLGKKVVTLNVGDKPEMFMPVTVKTIVDSMKKSMVKRSTLASKFGITEKDAGLTFAPEELTL